MSGVAVVTGAGSGVGRAVAVMLAAEGFHVVLTGRREAALRETVALAPDLAEKSSVFTCDVRSLESVNAMAAAVLDRHPDVEVLVNAAGTNVPARALAVLSPEDYREILETNLDGAHWCTQAFLTTMRRRKSGTIVNIVSDSGLHVHGKAGAAYVASKFGLAGLTEAVNFEERQHGIRACAVFPGEIDTPILDRRPQPPTPEARKNMLRSEDVAECVLLAIRLPPRALVEQILVRPTIL